MRQIRPFFSLIIVALLVFAVFVPAEVQAQDGLVPCGGESQDPCNFCHTFQLVSNIITFLLVPSSLNGNIPIVPLLAGLMIAVGGFFFLTAAASPQNVERGRTIFFAVVIGLLIVYGSWLFINLFLTTLGATSFTGFGGMWWQFDCAFN